MCLTEVIKEERIKKDLMVKKLVFFDIVKQTYFTGIGNGEMIPISNVKLTRNTGNNTKIVHKFDPVCYKLGFHFYDINTPQKEICDNWKNIILYYHSNDHKILRFILCKIPKGSKITIGKEDTLQCIVAQQFYFIIEEQI